MYEYREDLEANERAMESVKERTENRLAMHRTLYGWIEEHIRDNYRDIEGVLSEYKFTNISEATEIIIEKFREEIIDKGPTIELAEFSKKACLTVRVTNESFYKKELDEIREIRRRYSYIDGWSAMSDYERGRIIELNEPLQKFIWQGSWAKG